MKMFKLSELGEFKNGANFPKGSYGKGDKIINVKDLFKGRFIEYNSLDELKPNTLKDKSIYLVEDDDILFTRSSLVQSGAGMCAMVKNPPNNVLYCGFIIRYRINNKKIYPLYILYLLRSPKYRKLFTGSQQTNITNINQETLGSIEIPIPTDTNGDISYDKQKEIVDILDKIDTTIETNCLINSKLENLCSDLFNYWFMQFNFPNEENLPYCISGGDMKYDENMSMNVPSSWEMKEIGSLFESQSGFAFKSSEWKEKGHSVLTIKSINDNGRINMNSCSYISNNFDQKLLKYSVENGNIIFAMSGNTIGKIGLVASYIKNVLINQRVLIIKTKTNSVAYLYFLLRNKKIMNCVERIGQNSAQPNISENQIRNISFYIPNSELLSRFNDFCDNKFKIIINNEIQNQKLDELKKLLIPRILN